MIKDIFLILNIIAICLCLQLSKFQYVNLDTNEYSKFDNFTICNEENTNYNINCFDISDDGKILISLNNNIIYVYNQNLEFEYGLQYHTDDTVVAYWEGNNIAIYFNRSDVSTLLSPTGKIIQAYNVNNTTDNDEAYQQIFNTHIKATKNFTYILENSSSFLKIFKNGYSTLVQTDNINKQTSIIYINKQATFNVIMDISYTVLLFIIIICIIKYKIKKYSIAK